MEVRVVGKGEDERVGDVEFLVFGWLCGRSWYEVIVVLSLVVKGKVVNELAL